MLETEFSPNCIAQIQMKRGVVEIQAEDWGTPYVIIYFADYGREWYWIVSKRHLHPISSFESLPVARNFAQRFPIDFPEYDEVVERLIARRCDEADFEYLRAAEQRKKHKSYSLPPGMEMMLVGKI